MGVISSFGLVRKLKQTNVNFKANCLLVPGKGYFEINILPQRAQSDLF
jgi:hypothetical protein